MQYLLGVHEGDLEAGQQKCDRDTRAHRAGTDDSDRLHPRGSARSAGDSERGALGEEEVPPCSRLLRLDQLLRFLGVDMAQGREERRALVDRGDIKEGVVGDTLQVSTGNCRLISGRRGVKFIVQQTKKYSALQRSTG